MRKILTYTILLATLPVILFTSCIPQDCTELRKFIRDFESNHNSCTKDRDCQIVGSGGAACDGGGVYIFIRTEFAKQGQSYIDSYIKNSCDQLGMSQLPSDSPASYPRCTFPNGKDKPGICDIRSESGPGCFGGGDAGPSTHTEPKPEEIPEQTVEQKIESPENTSKNPILNYSCDILYQRWDEFAKNNRECQVDSDCYLTGTIGNSGSEPGDCNCNKALRNSEGDAISKKSKPVADLYMQRYKECAKDRECGYDIPSAPGVRCVQNLCTAIKPTRGCL